MELLGSAIMQYMVSVIWPFLRISSMIGAMFILGSRMLPIRIRLVFCIVITWAVIPLIPPVESGIELFSLEGAIVTINQIIIGTTLGFVTEFIAQCFILAGQVVAMQTGLGFASIMDPVNGQSWILSTVHPRRWWVSFSVCCVHWYSLELTVTWFSSI